MKLHENFERLSRIINPSYLSLYEQMGWALKPVQQHHLEITRALEFSGRASLQLANIANANQHLQDMIIKPTAANRAFKEIQGIHRTWLDMPNMTQNSLDQLQAMSKLSLCNVTYRLTIAEQLFARVDYESLWRTGTLPKPVIQNLDNTICGVSVTYERLAKSIKALPEITHLPAFTMPGATREVFTTGYALDAICISEESETDEYPTEVQLIADVEEETSGCIALLQSVDPALARPYIGARDALSSTNADRARHILISLRELWSHLLRRLAPDELVREWLPSDDKALLHNKKPTREDRVFYICRNIKHEPLSDFVVRDTRALVELINFFNRVHKLEHELTDEQLRAILLKTDSWLMYILQIWEGAK